MKKLSIITAVIFTITSFASCSTGPTWHHCEGSVWNTLYSIDYYADANLDDSIQAAMRKVELSVSAFDPNSTVTRANHSSTPIEVDSLFADVFRASQEINRYSNGLFDPTVAPLINLWGFGYTGSTDSIPSDDAIANVITTVGISDCKLIGGKLYKKSPTTEFNFSAIAKGYGCDYVAATLAANGCSDYKVEIGGEIALSGHNSHGGDWRIMIDAPIASDTIRHDRLGVVAISQCGIATSGSYRNYHDTPQGRRSHTIDPTTGHPLEVDHNEPRQVSVTVIASNTMIADGLATACMAMNLSDAIKMIEAIPTAEALIVTPTNNGKWNILRTSGFPNINI
jgi:thiamine biosynthesis lipoprotein